MLDFFGAQNGIELARTVVLVSALAALGSLLRKASHKSLQATFVVEPKSSRPYFAKKSQPLTDCDFKMVPRIFCLTHLHFRFSKISKNPRFWPKNKDFFDLT